MIRRLKPKTLLSKLMISYLVVILVTLLVLGGIMSYLVEEYFYGAREWEVNTQARKVADMLEEPLQENDQLDIKHTAETLSQSFESKISVYDYEGDIIVIADHLDSDIQNEKEAGEEKAGRDTVSFEEQELNHVLMGNSLTKKVFGPQAKHLLVAIPVYQEIEDDHSGDNNAEVTREISRVGDEDQSEEEEKEVIGIVSVSARLKGIEDTLANISRITLTSGGVAVVVAGVFALSLSKKITKPLSSINKKAKALAKGEFSEQIGQEVLEKSDDELGRISQTFNLAAEEIEKTIKEQKKLAIFRKHLVDNASHEFRAPLSSIRGYSELMLDGVILQQDYDKYLHLIWKNAVELNHMVDNLLDLSSLESGKTELDKSWVDPNEILKSARDIMLPEAAKKDQKIVVKEEEQVQPFQGDKHRVKQIVLNLLKNATQYTPEGGRITLKAFEQSEYMALQVSDTGIGIPEVEKAKIFQRFYKVDKARSQGEEKKTTGLGLAIVHELVKMHDGKIEVESEEGSGSTFTVYFPLEKDA